MERIGDKILKIFFNALPVIFMILLIPSTENDYSLTVIYIVIIAICLIIKYEKMDALFLGLGFTIMLISEYLFISTGVETFNRNSLFGVMPVWLPFLWAYPFVVIKRVVNILNQD